MIFSLQQLKDLNRSGCHIVLYEIRRNISVYHQDIKKINKNDGQDISFVYSRTPKSSNSNIILIAPVKGVIW